MVDIYVFISLGGWKRFVNKLPLSQVLALESGFLCVQATACACTHGRCGEGIPFLWKPSIILTFSTVSSDHRLGGQPISSRHCLAMGPTILWLGWISLCFQWCLKEKGSMTALQKSGDEWKRLHLLACNSPVFPRENCKHFMGIKQS